MAALVLTAAWGGITLTAGPVEAEGYYVASMCNPANPQSTTDGPWFSEGGNFKNASTTKTTRARCGLPNDDALANINFEFLIKRNGTGTSTCAGFVRDSSGNWVYSTEFTSHSSNNDGVYSKASTANGPAGNDTYTYATHCSLAPGHSLERLRLY